MKSPLANFLRFVKTLQMRELIDWFKLKRFAFVLAAVAVLVTMIIDDPNYILYSLTFFLILILFLIVDAVIDDYREKERQRRMWENDRFVSQRPKMKANGRANRH